MRTLGINISHNASICQVTDGKIDFYYEEDRFNKRKYYAPKHGDCYFKVIDEKVKDKPDYVVVAATVTLDCVDGDNNNRNITTREQQNRVRLSSGWTISTE